MTSRITGLASGMDIDTLVKGMMQPMQTRIDRVLQQRTRQEWVQEAYNEINGSLARFVVDSRLDFGLAVRSSTGALFKQDLGNLPWVKSATSSDSELVEITASAGAVDGSFTVSVHRLAENWSAASAEALREPPTVSGDPVRTNSIANHLGLSYDAVVDFTLATESGKVRISSNPAAVAGPDTQLVKIDLNTTSLSELARSISSAGVGVKATYDAGIRRFFLQTTGTGTDSTLSVSDASLRLGSGVGGFISSGAGGASLLGLKSSSGAEVTTGVTYAGVDALVDIGPAKGILQSSNEFTVNGISYSLRQLGEASVRVATDVEGAYEKVKSFVDDYNQLIDKLRDKLGEKSDRDYQPLTDAQRETMTEDQVKKWEEKAKTGLLAGSQELSSLFSAIRTGMVSKVEGLTGSLTSLHSIGIGTAAYSIDGRLEIDEVKLKSALRDDADGVLQLLFKTADPAVTDKTEQRKQSGLVTRLFDNVVDGMKQIINRAGTGENAALYRSVQTTILIDFVTEQDNISMIDRELAQYGRTILNLNDRFSITQTRYYNRFTAMERAIDQANRQSAWLTQQLSGMSGGSQ